MSEKPKIVFGSFVIGAWNWLTITGLILTLLYVEKDYIAPGLQAPLAWLIVEHMAGYCTLFGITIGVRGTGQWLSETDQKTDIGSILIESVKFYSWKARTHKDYKPKENEVLLMMPGSVWQGLGAFGLVATIVAGVRYLMAENPEELVRPSAPLAEQAGTVGVIVLTSLFFMVFVGTLLRFTKNRKES